MKKRILSLLLCISLCFSMVCPSVFADDSVSEHEHQWVDCGISSFDGLIVGLPVSVTVQQCSVCKIYLHTCNILGNVIKYPAITGYTDMGNELVQFLLPYVYKLIGQNATAEKVPTGIGRKDLPGYASDDGTPSVSSRGGIIWQTTFDDNTKDYIISSFYKYDKWNPGTIEFDFSKIRENPNYYKPWFVTFNSTDFIIEYSSSSNYTSYYVSGDSSSSDIKFIMRSK